MDSPTREQYEQAIANLTSFCFRKLANLEARFIILCTRAEAAGIDCSDLHELEQLAEAEATPSVRIVN